MFNNTRTSATVDFPVSEVLNVEVEHVDLPVSEVLNVEVATAF